MNWLRDDFLRFFGSCHKQNPKQASSVLKKNLLWNSSPDDLSDGCKTVEYATKQTRLIFISQLFFRATLTKANTSSRKNDFLSFLIFFFSNVFLLQLFELQTYLA